MPDNPTNPPSRLHLVTISALTIATAIWLFYLGVTRQFDGPPWVGYVISMIFLSGGVQALAMAMGRAGLGRWVALFWLAGFSSVFWWVPFAGEPEKCNASIGPFSLPTPACEIGFGFMAAIFTAYTIFVARVWFL